MNRSLYVILESALSPYFGQGLKLGLGLDNIFPFQVSLVLTRACVGTGNGLLSTTIYTAEVTSKELRGSFSVFEGVTRSMGMITIYAFGAVMSWNHVAFAGIIFPIIGFLLLFNSPESPIFLVSEGEIEKAKESLKKLKTIKNVSEEVENIVNEVKISKEMSSGKNKSSWQYIKNIKKHPSVYKPFLIVFLLRCVFKIFKS